MSDKTKDDLEHAGIQAQLATMAADISISFAQVEANFKTLRAKGDAESYVRGIQYENILKEQKITNGRIKIQEKTTEVLRIMSHHKWLTGVSLYGIFNILQITTVENIVKWIWVRLKPNLPNLSKIIIEETCTSGCIYQE